MKIDRPNLVVENKGRYLYSNTFIKDYEDKDTLEREEITSEKIAVKTIKSGTATTIIFKLIAYNDDEEDHSYTLKAYQITKPSSFGSIGIWDGSSIVSSYSFSISKRTSKEIEIRFISTSSVSKGEIANCILRIERSDNEELFDTVQTIVVIQFANYDDVKKESEYFVTDDVLFPSGATYDSQTVVEQIIADASEEIAYWNLKSLQGTSFAYLSLAKEYCICSALLKLLDRAMIYILSGGAEFMPIYDKLQQRKKNAEISLRNYAI